VSASHQDTHRRTASVSHQSVRVGIESGLVVADVAGTVGIKDDLGRHRTASQHRQGVSRFVD
jgi:hypothetical protein